MSALDLILSVPCILSACAALFFPLPTALALFAATVPFADAYVAGGSLGLLLAAWLARGGLGACRGHGRLLPFGAAVGFLFCAVALSLFESGEEGRMTSEIVQWGLGVGAFSAVVLRFGGEDSRTLMRGLVAGAWALSGARWTIDLLDLDFEAVTSLLQSGQSNYASIYLLFAGVVAPLALWGSRLSLASLATIAAALSVMVANGSRASVVAGLALVLLSQWYRYEGARIWLVVVSTVPVVVLAAAMGGDIAADLYNPNTVVSLANFETNFSNLERLGLLLYAADVFMANPLGLGLGSSSWVFPAASFTIEAYPHPHNTLAMLVVELGWLGLAGYLFVAVLLVRKALAPLAGGDPAAGILAAALLLTSVYEAMLFNGVLAVVYWCLLGVVVVGYGGNESLLVRVQRFAPCAA